jgi:hypothetical protein
MVVSNVSSREVRVAEIPVNMDEIEPGLLLALLVDATDKSTSGFDHVMRLRAHQRLVSYFQAKVSEDMEGLLRLVEEESDLEGIEELEGAAAEIGAALHLTRRAAEADLALAVDLIRRLPRVWRALAEGAIDLRRARVMVYGTARLSEDLARLVVDRVIERAPQLTSGQVYALVRKLVIEADPEEAERRYRERVLDRRVIGGQPRGVRQPVGLGSPPRSGG